MRLTLWISTLFLIMILSGTFLFIKFSQPLDIGTVASSDDKKTVLVGIGNKGYSQVKLTEVTVNMAETPNNVKLQVSNLVEGFILIDDEHKVPDAISFKKINEVSIKKGTSPLTNFEKNDDGTATKDDIIYGVYLDHNHAINEVNLTYKYFGMTFNKSIKIK